VIVYADASALVKRYVSETHSQEVQELFRAARVIGTSELSRVEVASALSKAVRMGSLTDQEAAKALRALRADWPDFLRLRITDAVLSRGEELAFGRGLRGCDAVHLASAMLWQEILAEPVHLATFDRQLWVATKDSELKAWPSALTTGGSSHRP